MASPDFTQGNHSAVQEFITTPPVGFPYLYPANLVHFYLTRLPASLQPEKKARYLRVCRGIVQYWEPFQQGLSSCLPVIFRLDTAPELVEALSIVSALITSAANNARVSTGQGTADLRFPILSFFCTRVFTSVGYGYLPVYPHQVLISLISQLMMFITYCRRNIDLKSVIYEARDSYSEAKNNLDAGLSFLKALLSALPQQDAVFIVIDRLRSLNGSEEAKRGLLVGLVQLVKWARPRLNIKLVVTGAAGYPENLDHGSVKYQCIDVRPAYLGERDTIDLDEYERDIGDWIGALRTIPS